VPDAGINRVRLDFGVRDHSHLDGIGDHHPLHMGTDHTCNRCSIAGRLDDDDIVRRQSRSKRRNALKSIDAVRAKLKQAILYIERNPTMVKSITSFPYIRKSF
jgi:hypothetical protein